MECIFFSLLPFSYSWPLCLPRSCHKNNFRATSALWGPSAGGRWAGERSIPAGAHLTGPVSSITLFSPSTPQAEPSGVSSAGASRARISVLSVIMKLEQEHGSMYIQSYSQDVSSGYISKSCNHNLRDSRKHTGCLLWSYTPPLMPFPRHQGGQQSQRHFLSPRWPPLWPGRQEWVDDNREGRKIHYREK